MQKTLERTATKVAQPVITIKELTSLQIAEKVLLAKQHIISRLSARDCQIELHSEQEWSQNLGYVLASDNADILVGSQRIALVPTRRIFKTVSLSMLSTLQGCIPSFYLFLDMAAEDFRPLGWLPLHVVAGAYQQFLNNCTQEDELASAGVMNKDKFAVVADRPVLIDRQVIAAEAEVNGLVDVAEDFSIHIGEMRGIDDLFRIIRYSENHRKHKDVAKILGRVDQYQKKIRSSLDESLIKVGCDFVPNFFPAIYDKVIEGDEYGDFLVATGHFLQCSKCQYKYIEYVKQFEA